MDFLFPELPVLALVDTFGDAVDTVDLTVTCVVVKFIGIVSSLFVFPSSKQTKGWWQYEFSAWNTNFQHPYKLLFAL